MQPTLTPLLPDVKTADALRAATLATGLVATRGLRHYAGASGRAKALARRRAAFKAARKARKANRQRFKKATAVSSAAARRSKRQAREAATIRAFAAVLSKSGVFGKFVTPLREGLKLLKSDPQRFKKFNAPNGWGVYEDFVRFVENYLEACRAHRSAIVSASG